MKTADRRTRNYKKTCVYPGCGKEFLGLYANPAKEKYCEKHKIIAKRERAKIRNAIVREKGGGKLPSDIKYLLKMTCKKCGYVARSKHDKRRHYFYHKYVELKVPPDQKEYYTDSQGRRYLRQIFFCPYCNKKFIYKKSRNKHVERCKKKD